MSSDVLDGEAKVRIFSDKLEKLYGIFSNITGKKADSKKQKDAFNDLKADILMLHVDAVSKMSSVQENGADQPNNIMEMFIDLKREFSSFRIYINTKVDHISKQIAPEGIARHPELQEPTLHEELVKVNLKPEVKTYVFAVRNSSSAVKRVKSDSKLVINGASKVSSLKSVGKMPKRKAIFLTRLSLDTTVYEVSQFLNALKLNHLLCRRIRTKFQSYPSFHVEVSESDFHLLSDASIWPEGCLVTEFFGRLKDQIYPDNTNLPSDSDFNNTGNSN
ncbi:hypothetical protein AVEN_101809-1 [Araneus ventricosus]|uniref:Uncharacterized protein n=1 Tax=Araneus ventricosus TaxID=182803 RepID=A0A4Y2D2I2_ARAVE|nr:hypothetical protein AVEN_101809-1 [Araneus ventricosus]